MSESISPLIDRFGRRIEYLRLSVTDRCDLRCSYCIPEGFNNFEEPDHWLTFDEIEQVIRVFSLLGVGRIRLTGGEPLLRKEVSSLAKRLSQLQGISDLSLSTNATQLSKHAPALKEAGVSRINVSLDSLRSDRIQQINGRHALEQIMSGLEAAKQAGFHPIKINMVALRGINDDEIDDMVAFCMEQGFILRLIETMPMGDTGRHAGFLDLQPIKNRLQEKFGLLEAVIPGGGPARYLQSVDGHFSVGFITPLSQHFCETCNRVRLSVDGTLYLCLGQDDKMELRPFLRDGISDDDLALIIREAIELKPERHEFKEAPTKIMRFMSMTGG